MKKAKLYFELELDYTSKQYAPLIQIGNKIYSPERKKYIWTFPIENIKQVLAILGRPFLLEPIEVALINIYCDANKQKVDVSKIKGAGFVNVELCTDKPNMFVVTTVRERMPQNTYVSFETVQALWDAIKDQPLNHKVLTCTVAEKYCKQLGFTGFNIGKDGNFSWKYMFGSRKIYLVFYAAIKVLVHYGAVEHIVEASKSGISRLKNKFEIQTFL
jgi:hypothetical protein